MTAPGALGDIRVVDVSGSIATGYCAKLMADHGAEVVNLEPAAGFVTRRAPPFLSGIAEPESSAMHAYLHAGKRSVRADGLDPGALAALMTTADLVLDDGSAPDVTGWQDAWCRGVRSTISWYGPGGPYERFVGSDAQCFALNGMLRNIGHPEGPPLIPTGYQAQMIGGVTAFIASLAEVLAGELANRDMPVHVETSIFEAMLCFTDVGVVAAYNTGLEATRMGINRYPPTYPMGVFPCRDGWLGVTVLTPAQWHSFCELIDLAELADVELFQTTLGRLEAADVIEPMMLDKLGRQSAEELFYRGQAAGVPLARVPTMEELFGVDQFRARDAFGTATLRDGRALAVPGCPFRLLDVPPDSGDKVAALGADTEMFSG